MSCGGLRSFLKHGFGAAPRRAPEHDGAGTAAQDELCLSGQSVLSPSVLSATGIGRSYGGCAADARLGGDGDAAGAHIRHGRWRLDGAAVGQLLGLGDAASIWATSPATHLGSGSLSSTVASEAKTGRASSFGSRSWTAREVGSGSPTISRRSDCATLAIESSSLGLHSSSRAQIPWGRVDCPVPARPACSAQQARDEIRVEHYPSERLVTRTRHVR